MRRWRIAGSIMIAMTGIGVVLVVWPGALDSLRPLLRQVPYVSEAGKRYYDWRYERFRFPDLEHEARGDGLAASEIYLQYPMGLAEDFKGRVYVADRGHVVWRIGSDGRGRIVAGTGSVGEAEERADAREASLGIPEGLCVDAQGRVYFADSRSNKVLRIDDDGALVRIAGTGSRGDSGDGGLARDAELNRPFGVALDPAGRLFIADYGNHRVRVVLPDGTIEAYAGTGEPGREGDGGPATQARLNEPYGLFLDASDRLVITDSGNHVLRRVDEAGIIATIAGTGAEGYTGDGGMAGAATFSWPQGGAAGEAGTLYVNDEHNHAIRAIDSAGRVRTVIGNGRPERTPDGLPARGAGLLDPEAVLVRSDGSLLISEGVPEDACERVANSRDDRRPCGGLVRSVLPDGTTGTFAGRASFTAGD